MNMNLIEALEDFHDDDDFTGSSEDELATLLQELLTDQGCKVQPYADSGMMTNNTGLTVTLPSGNAFQVTIVASGFRG